MSEEKKQPHGWQDRRKRKRPQDRVIDYHIIPERMQGYVRATASPVGEAIDFDAAADYIRVRTKHNWQSIRESAVCGCVYCLSFYPARRVQRWEDAGDGPAGEWTDDTAICPCCGHASVIGDLNDWPMTASFFLAMRERMYPRLDRYTDRDTVVCRDSADEMQVFRTLYMMTGDKDNEDEGGDNFG